MFDLRDILGLDFNASLFDIKPGSKKETELLNKLRLRSKYLELFQVPLSMFTYEGLPTRKEFLEIPLLRYGWNAMGQDTKGLHIGFIAYNDIDEYGLPVGAATLMTCSGYEMRGEIGKDIIIGYNNEMRLPELLVDDYADMFNETDKSIKCILDKARLLPIPLCKDSKVKSAIDEAFKDVKIGNLKAVAYEAIRDDFSEGDSPVTMLELTQPEHTDKLQYMSKFYDDLLRRFYTKYGHPLSSASKMAQVSTAELEGYSTMTRTYPSVMLESRKKFIDDCNAAFGTSMSVDYSEAWQHLKNDIVLNNEEEGESDDTTGDVQQIESSAEDAD